MNLIVDTGPLVAFIDKRDQYHEWVGKQFSELDPPFHTCEGVIAETCFLLHRGGISSDFLFELISRKDLVPNPVIADQASFKRVRTILDTYQNLTASFADACLVHMYEKQSPAKIFTLDSHFSVYRTEKGKPLSLITPS